MDKLDRYVFEQWAERWTPQTETEIESPDDSGLRQALAESEATLSEVLADEEKLRRLGVFEQARDAALDRIAAAKRGLASPRFLDLEAMVQEAMPSVLEGIERIKAGESPVELMTDDGKRVARHALSKDIQAVFVRPAASRSNKLPIEDRVRIVWSHEELLELPRRGERFEPRPYVWT